MMDLTPNMLGAYGPWARTTASRDGYSLSFLNHSRRNLETWKRKARVQVLKLLSPPDTGTQPEVHVNRTYRFNRLVIEELSWKLPYGPETEAVFLKPESSAGPLPGILGFHDHGGIKYFGKQKIIQTGTDIHPIIKAHQQEYYGGTAWANELAGQGYGVLVHDVFPFESRKILPSDLPAHVVRKLMAAHESVHKITTDEINNGAAVMDYDVPPGEPADRIHLYDAFASRHEEIIAKSLFSTGLTWPGVTTAEDTFALDYLCSRPDIDGSRIGCCGLSGGGLRTNYLAGLDDRIRCSVTAGFMTTWEDFVFQKCFTHTWMIYIPFLPALMDFPEILGMRAPLPSLVLTTTEDPLFSSREVEKAGRTLEAIYARAGRSDACKISCHRGPHKFDLPMQKEAFDWFDTWLEKR